MELSVKVALALGALSVVISAAALIIARCSDRMMKALGNLHYDEKMAMMNAHLRRIRSEKTKTLESIEALKYDFWAVTSLRAYADSEKKEKLIRHYIIPMVEELLRGPTLEGPSATALQDILETAEEYNIGLDDIKELGRKFREGKDYRPRGQGTFLHYEERKK